MFLVESVNTGVSGGATLAEILVEAEASYGNIVRRMMTLEHKAIVTEDATLLQEAGKGFVQTVKDWIVKWYTKIKNWIASQWTKMMSAIMTDKA